VHQLYTNKKEDVSQGVISTWTLNQLKNFNADTKIYTSTLFHLQSFLLVSDLKLYIKQKFRKSFLTFFTPLYSYTYCTLMLDSNSNLFPVLCWNASDIKTFSSNNTTRGRPSALNCQMITHTTYHGITLYITASLIASCKSENRQQESCSFS
jgi:hypothetical protein